MLDLLLVLGVAFAVYYVSVMRRFGILNANALFVYIQMIMAIGTFASLEPSLPSDTVYGYVVLVSMIGYFIGSGLVLAAGARRPVAHQRLRAVRPLPAVWALVALSCLIIVLYYSAVGYSALFEGLKNSLSGGQADIAGARLDSYSGDRYLYPGYVNQFKNAILPGLLLVIFVYWRRERQSHVVLGASLVAIALFGILGTGQRGAFIQFLVVAAYFLYLMNGRNLPRRSWLILPAGLVFMLTSTVALGRSNTLLGQDASVVDRIWIAGRELGSRVFQVQQESAVAGFRYIYEQPIQWGAEWARGLLGILPGSPGTDLPNRIYQMLYGTDRGTAPPSVWGSIYHNFGWGGIVIVPVVLGALVALVSLRSMDGSVRGSLEAVGVAGVSTSIGFWAAGGPESLLNTGLVTYAVLWLWGRRQAASAHADVSPETLEPDAGQRSISSSPVRPRAPHGHRSSEPRGHRGATSPRT
ncbi:O-antigen polymerase [Intrasporangium sp. YIM S08009]|uniref:O-antigen polymerase n=1 Tax=Intrasporangium zincisolvens TaxID=3080018 RepID=UPI002B058E19|nr:O-antigen polymerase [Intrasporangium sp. YIM S08009]